MVDIGMENSSHGRQMEYDSDETTVVDFKWRMLGKELKWLASNEKRWWASHGEQHW